MGLEMNTTKDEDTGFLSVWALILGHRISNNIMGHWIVKGIGLCNETGFWKSKIFSGGSGVRMKRQKVIELGN